MFLPEGTSASRALLWAALLLVVIVGIKLTAYVFIILAVSVILTLLGWPAMRWMKGKGLPYPVSAVILTIVALLFILLLVLLTVYSFHVLVRDLPLYQAELDARMAGIAGALAGLGLSGETVPTSPDLSSLVRLVLSSLLSLSDLLLYLFFIGVTTFFMLLEAPHLSDRLGRLPWVNREKTSRLARLSRSMMDFVVVRTETNLVHGVLFGGALALMGVHGALLWGVLTFVLSYIPYIGLIIAAIPAIFFAWLQFGVWGAVAVIALVCFLNLFVENPVFSYFASRTYEIPPLLIILSVVFWGWLLGFAGMVFAVPLTLLVLALVQMSDELAWVNVLLGADRIFGEREGGAAGDSGVQWIG